jgi:hypothetical protein
MTAMGAALRNAGIIPANERLMDVAKDAVKSNPRNWDGAKDVLYKSIKNDPELLWAMLEPYRVVATQRLLTEAATLLREPVQLKEVGGRTRSVDRSMIDPPSGMDAVARVARLSLLDTFKINGRSIGDCTPEEAIRWAGARERDAAFVRMLTANLPAGRPIREFRRPEDTQELYDRARADHAA